MKTLPFQLFSRKSITQLGVLFLLAVYYLGVRPMLSSTSIYHIEVSMLGGLVVLTAGALLFSLISLLALIFSKKTATMWNRLRGQMIFVFSMVLIIVVIVGLSQLLAHTPPILSVTGKPLPNSIASMEKVRLGGVEQWLIIRGEDVHKPVLLFLSGGPGASEAARVLRFNQELEKHFVVVIWEQRGCGKSYPSLNPKADLTMEQYVSDLIELSEMLRVRFNQQKIYLVGHSWGTILGVHAVQARPDLFHAYVGTAQMVDVRETDEMIYDMVLQYSRETGDTKFVQTLQTQGQPPYLGKNPIVPYSTLFGREYAIYEFPNIKDEVYRRDGDILMLMLKQPEYGWLDRVYYLLGLMNTFNIVYPQLQDMDFRMDALHFELPVYIVLGRKDMNNPYQIPEEYYNLLEAPSKQLHFFEESGHGMIWEEAAKYHDLMVHKVLPETFQP
jgi:pimeloyl-ACP methyl ester carboxylesterase